MEMQLYRFEFNTVLHFLQLEAQLAFHIQIPL